MLAMMPHQGHASAGQCLGNGPVAPHRLRYVLPDGGY
jgi:hypothetical protein